ncbi:hypothetical protein KFZ70_05445 [Tamlana fucoidanivorans]|uniref:Right-handed parallel beta-helix repeat-containing protein n=1 Tax=Allotamlana fucoidanivorans TaxID=2583814 RepID=A0A5C4SS05_9FLAO|nr:hypothetical protein [Tamlana fucoidanivorans]TNJ47045.1 hypothetical protein FGF67_00530 [Tamlana fucoidanivorans]
MMKIKFSLVIVFLLSFSCNEKKSERKNIDIKEIDSLYTIDSTYAINDIRRYGVFPGRSIGIHPKLKKDKLEILLDVAESGVNLVFPEGNYSRALNIINRRQIELNLNNVTFNGAIVIKNCENVKLLGNVTSFTQLYIRESVDITLDKLVLKSDVNKNTNGNRNFGCSIHAGTKRLSVNKIVVEDLASSPDLKYVKAAVIIHGHNNEPQNIKLDSVIIKSSDRHGLYLTGNEIDLGYVSISNFGLGTSEGMDPMEGGIEGEQYDFSGLWVKNAFDSEISKVVIDINGSKGKYYVNYDVGEDFRPCIIDTLVIKGTNSTLTKRKLKRTGVINQNEIYENE